MNLLEKVRNAGITGAGGASFPTHVKLKAKAEYILLNGAECEPLLRVDQQLMEYKGKEVIKGFQMAAEIVGAEKAIIGIKVKHKKVIKQLRAQIEELGLAGRMEVGELPDIYPAGDEQVLVYELTGRIVPETGIPIAVGCVVMNTETALNVYNAASNVPVIMKYVTITGDVPNPITVEVPIGTPLEVLYKLSGRDKLDGYEVIDGGPMMGNLLYNKYGYVTRKTKGLIILKEDHSLVARKKKTLQTAKMMNKTACEQCRLCTDLCPRYLLGHGTSPHKMVRAMGYSQEGDENKTIAFTCCQCNLCEYFSCPAGINPKMANLYYMVKLREAGIKHTPAKEFKVRAMREYRLIPSKRLIHRLNIQKFDAAAPLTEVNVEPELVGISMQDFIGSPAKAMVAVGDMVVKGQMIADSPEGELGTSVHSSIDGKVEAIERGYIIIRRV